MSTLVRITPEELAKRAALRKPGYEEAFQLASVTDADGRRLLISQEALRVLWEEFGAPGLGDEIHAPSGCCGG
jgi:hypothetical protein